MITGESEAKVQRVLVVDDEEMIRVNLEAYLEDEGYEVLAADSGEAALEILKTEKVDFAIVDMRLPGIDGNIVILEARKLDPKLRVVIHTGSSEYVVPPELLEIGITQKNVLLKPLSDMKILVEMVNKLIAEPESHS
jgi:CheY-like chemotaxis protein